MHDPGTGVVSDDSEVQPRVTLNVHGIQIRWINQVELGHIAVKVTLTVAQHEELVSVHVHTTYQKNQFPKGQ